MNSNNNNKKSKAERRAQSQRDKANAKAALGNGQSKAKPPKKGRAGPRGQKAVAAAYANGQSSGQAQIFRNSVDSCRIVHRELIASVVGTAAFTVAQTFALNPALTATFPWLANEAAGWERYRFNKLRFCYYTRTGSNVPGSVMLAPDYDAADAAPVSEQIASSYEDTEEDAPWKDICCDLPQRELMGDMKEKYLRSGALAANQDIKTYDAGQLFLCTVDGTAVNWGKLWVEYDVTLFTPQVPSGGFQASGTLQASVAGSAASTPFGTSPVATGAVILAGAATNVLSISNVAVGQEIQVTVQGTGTVISAAALTTLVGLTLVNTLFAGFPAAATSYACVSTYTVTAVDPTLVVALTATTITGSQALVAVLAPKPAY